MKSKKWVLSNKSSSEKTKIPFLKESLKSLKGDLVVQEM